MGERDLFLLQDSLSYLCSSTFIGIVGQEFFLLVYTRYNIMTLRKNLYFSRHSFPDPYHNPGLNIAALLCVALGFTAQDINYSQRREYLIYCPGDTDICTSHTIVCVIYSELWMP